MRKHLLLPAIVLVLFSLACTRNKISPYVKRLDTQITKALSEGKKLEITISSSSEKKMVTAAGAQKNGLVVREGDKSQIIGWRRIAPTDVVMLAEKAAGDDPNKLIMAAELAADLGLKDVSGDILSRAYQIAPRELPEISRVAAKIAPLSGSPIADAANSALASIPFSEVRTERPRIFLRKSKWHGLTLEELRRRAESNTWQPYLAPLTEYTATSACLALKYLATRDINAANTAVELLQKTIYNGGTSVDGDALEEAAIAFDWLGEYPGFSGSDRKKAVERIVTASRRLMKRLQVGIHVFHTRMYTWATALTFAGIALKGEHPDAETFYNFGCRFWMTRLMPARAYQGGAWQNGFGYGQRYIVRSTFSFLSLMRSATGRDLWKTIATKQNAWAQDMFYFTLYTTRCDGSHPPFGDCFENRARHWDAPLALQYASETGDPYAAEYGAMLIEHYGPGAVEGRQSAIWDKYGLLYVDPDRPRKRPDDLPRSRCFGPNGMGCVVMLTGWKDTDTFVFFKCGDYFGNHGHFDQGHFEIYRWKPLVVEAGRYDGFGSPHRVQYYRKSIAHNTMLISDPRDPEDVGNQRTFTFQVAGNMNEYLNAPQCETGDIIYFNSVDDYTRVTGDVTAAYDPEKVRKFTRTLYYQQGKYLVVFDTVITTKPGMNIRFLVHCRGKTRVDGKHIIIENRKSRVVCESLLPEKARIKRPRPFEVNGKIFAPRHWNPKRSPYAGRVEISSPEPAPTHVYFLNIFTIGDTGIRPVTARIRQTGEQIILHLPDRKVVFSKTGKEPQVVKGS